MILSYFSKENVSRKERNEFPMNAKFSINIETKV